MDKISRGVWPTHDTKTSMSPTVSSERTCRLPACFIVSFSRVFCVHCTCTHFNDPVYLSFYCLRKICI